MSFMSVTFMIFCIVVFLVYFITPKKQQWAVLLLANYVFYMWSSYINIVYILFTTLTTYIIALLIGKISDKLNMTISNAECSKEEIKELKKNAKITQKFLMIFALVLNFGLLVIFKYGNDIIDVINNILSIGGYKGFNHMSLVVPLGISFYTFQTMSYIIDVYRGKYKPEKNLSKFALFVSFFPQLVQGPISRYDELADKLYEGRAFDYKKFVYGLQLVVWGFFKKLVIADRISIMTETIFDNYTEYGGVYILFIAIFYSFQVYTDFSGGMDIACGIAEALGIELVDNFKRPFFADNLGEYWRRWHISLNDWLRDYVFYPVSLSKMFTKLGKYSRKYLGKRVGKYFAIYIATFVVRIINAIWHGGSPKYFINGFYNGILIILGMQCEPLFNKLSKAFRIRKESFVWKLFTIIRTFMLISFGRIIVKASDLTVGWYMLKSTFTQFNPWVLFDGSLYELGVPQKEFYCLILALLILLCVSFMQEKGIFIRDKIQEQGIVVRWTIYYVAIIFIVLCGVYGIGYDAAGFIYMQF